MFVVLRCVWFFMFCSRQPFTRGNLRSWGRNHTTQDRTHFLLPALFVCVCVYAHPRRCKLKLWEIHLWTERQQTTRFKVQKDARGIWSAVDWIVDWFLLEKKTALQQIMLTTREEQFAPLVPNQWASDITVIWSTFYIHMHMQHYCALKGTVATSLRSFQPRVRYYPRRCTAMNGLWVKEQCNLWFEFLFHFHHHKRGVGGSKCKDDN